MYNATIEKVGEDLKCMLHKLSEETFLLWEKTIILFIYLSAIPPIDHIVYIRQNLTICDETNENIENANGWLITLRMCYCIINHYIILRRGTKNRPFFLLLAKKKRKKNSNSRNNEKHGNG